MLKNLIIQNYALIEKLDINFENGFSVITGETGAGKSIILGAIGLLLGQRADTKAIKNGATKCVIEAHFDLTAYGMEDFFTRNELDYDPADCIIRRELHASGKSRAFINDVPAQLPLLKELGEQLIDVHSQHQNLLLNKEDFQLNVLDIIAKDNDELKTYKQTYKEYKSVETALAKAIEESKKDKAEEEFLRFQVEQLAALNLSDPNEQQEIEDEVETLSHAEDIKAELFKVDSIMTQEHGVLDMIKECSHSLANLEKMTPTVAELYQRTESAYIELKDISNEISSLQDSLEYDPQQLQQLNDRLNEIYEQEKKHRVNSLQELIDVFNGLQEKLDLIDNSEEHIAELEKKRNEMLKKVQQQADKLSSLRAKAAKEVEKQMIELLKPLGIPNVQFVIDLQKSAKPEPSGIDKVNFLFSANKNGTLQQVSAVASGGEIARVMLSLKALISSAVKLPTIIFDEIDTGVSGSIADKMAEMMKNMGQQNRQVISITHLPQIAAQGKNHYKVYKEDKDNGTVSHIIQLTHEQRVEEIAHMVSGATLTEAALNNARALLTNN